MNVAQQSHEDQPALWNGATGCTWVDMQESIDRLYRPFEDLLVEEVNARSVCSVLDVGCGTGGTTLAVARSLRGKGRCVGVDISEPMITAARARVERERSPTVAFICADAQSYGFEPASFDMIISRFGVMFFDDPVRAFTNLQQAAQKDAELALIAWRGAADNPFMTTAERAAAPLLPNIAPRVPDAPGQFAFADRSRVHRILEQSGWGEIDIRPVDVVCAFAEQELVRFFTRLGPLGRALQDADEATRARVIATVRPAFDTYVRGGQVRFDAACWMIGARSAGA